MTWQRNVEDIFCSFWLSCVESTCIWQQIITLPKSLNLRPDAAGALSSPNRRIHDRPDDTLHSHTSRHWRRANFPTISKNSENILIECHYPHTIHVDAMPMLTAQHTPLPYKVESKVFRHFQFHQNFSLSTAASHQHLHLLLTFHLTMVLVYMFSHFQFV